MQWLGLLFGSISWCAFLDCGLVGGSGVYCSLLKESHRLGHRRNVTYKHSVCCRENDMKCIVLLGIILYVHVTNTLDIRNEMPFTIWFRVSTNYCISMVLEKRGVCIAIHIYIIFL